MKLDLPTPWQKLLFDQISQNYFLNILAILELERKQGVEHFPPQRLIFNALQLCSPQKCKVVIIGQDPYHGEGQAHGLSFSVPMGVDIPPSLLNIYKELESDLGLLRAHHGNLEHWANQGVLLLNSALTVRAHEAGSHANIGWHTFTDALIKRLAEERHGLVFMLWGAHARSKKTLINPNNNHLILEAAHPSPLSAYRGFLGCKHFSKCNDYLTDLQQDPINWNLF